MVPRREFILLAEPDQHTAQLVGLRPDGYGNRDRTRIAPAKKHLPNFGILCHIQTMIVIGTEIVEDYLDARASYKGIKAARSQYDAWLDIVTRSEWRNPEEVKASYPKASILKASRVVFNIKGNDFRLIARVQYQAGVLAIRFFGTHAEYDQIDAETI